MRVLGAAALAVILAAAGPLCAMAQTQTDGSGQDNSVIAVPPAPPIVASPINPPMPPLPATPAPPGLVPVSPPADMSGDGSNADNGDTSAATAAPGTTTGGPPPSSGAATGQADTSQNQPPDQDTIPTPPNTWQPGKVAEIGVLDKVDGGVKEISVPVGGQSVVGDLQVNVLACVIRPPDQVPDAAVFLALQNTNNLSGPPDYRGWLVRSAPGAAVAGDASETFRIIDCS